MFARADETVGGPWGQKNNNVRGGDRGLMWLEAGHESSGAGSRQSGDDGMRVVKVGTAICSFI